MSPRVLEIVKILSNLKNEARERFKTDIKGLFGSFVRSEETSESDIDVLVEFHPGATLFDMAGLTLFLEDRLHHRVDVVPESGIRPELRPTILQEVVRL